MYGIGGIEAGNGDGCSLECVRENLEHYDVTPDRHINLAEEGIPKEYQVDFDEEQQKNNSTSSSKKMIAWNDGLRFSRLLPSV
ncbi:putative zinc-binding protein [Halorussus salinisoli]|uniref:putative zinc-binding protein n=1 Tax=Halorussus salinisoli TaxID=2558242 RepID=UPI0010C1CF94